MREHEPGTLERLVGGSSVPHCAVCWCCVDFERGGTITDVALLNDHLAAYSDGKAPDTK